ncbi:oligogalacturonate lyase family protein [Parafilimonas sp.]|uniref:oligogalacturonate lyase family protein n=1 Tax=Parafilimonas sp. TaxID=1969739 RepID=UPI0039E2F405
MNYINNKACIIIFLFFHTALFSQPVLETGGKAMPCVWIDKDTRHKIIRLSDSARTNLSFYFHNNPFIENKMVYYSTSKKKPSDINVAKQKTYSTISKDKQLYYVDLATKQTAPITRQPNAMSGEIAGRQSHNVYYQINDSVFITNIDTRETKLIYVFPANYKGSITTLNADETLLAGSKASDKQKKIYKKNPQKKDYFNLIYDAKQPNDLFTIDIKTKQLTIIHTENTWLGHVQFSPTDPDLLMFCHEGPWHKVDRIWTINVRTKKTALMHKRTMDMEIAGHEFFSPDGKKIYFDLQMPKGKTFFLAGVDIASGEEKKYSLTRDEWSVHYNISPDQKLFAGDGGDSGQVAKAKDGQWIYLFRPEGDHFVSEKLVNMKHHHYRLEPNVHFSPDGKWIIFRANFEGTENVYAVEISKHAD